VTGRRLRLLLAAGALLGPVAPVSAATSSTQSPALGPAAASKWTTSTLALGPLRQNPRLGIGAMPGRDNAASVRAGNRSYWFFGDTFINAPPSAVNSSAAVTTDLDATDGVTVTSSNVWTEDPVNAPVTLIPKNAAELAFEKRHASTSCPGSSDAFCGSAFAHWPGAAVYDARRHRLLVMTTKICRFGLRACTTDFTGQVLSQGVTAVDTTTGKVTRLAITHQERYSTPEGRDPTVLFGSGVFAGTAWGDGDYLYSAYDCDPYVFKCKLARVGLGLVNDRAAWRFFSGERRGKPSWTVQASSAPRVLYTGAAGGTIQWAPALKSWLAIYSIPYTNDIGWQVAPHPWGPWSDLQRLYTTMSPTTSGAFNYAAFAHPEYAQDGGLTQFITYYHNSSGELELIRAHFCPVETQLCT
jgi:hypothetical protein